MRGLMMDRPLLLSHFLERAEKLYPTRDIVSRTEKGIHRTNYADVARRTRRLATGLDKLGVKPGERVGTFAWNHYRHLELYFALTGSGRVLHTLNLRLFPEQVTFIANHAEAARPQPPNAFGYRQIRVPMVLMDRQIYGLECDLVTSDNYGGGCAHGVRWIDVSGPKVRAIRQEFG